MRKFQKINKRESLRRGYKDGYSKGYNIGFDAGFNRGYEVRATRASTPFEGTSIIIPTYNQKEFLQKCIDSIQQYTKESYELIVVDNASTDHTKTYLESIQGTIRLQINDTNLGFAGAVNQGLRMARGSTILILNNDTVVTTNWLSNLLACVNNNSRFGLVGPVTNYVGGDQQIPTSYDSIDSMQEYAFSHNHSDAGRWTKTSRLIGFCMMMRRDVFNRLGYFDEGFEIGNCEDDDYGLRAQLVGLDLIIANDTFIHHFGSVSMKSLGSEFDQVYGKNLIFYSEKWGDPHSLLANVQQVWGGESLSAIDFYPTHVVLQGMNKKFFWLENGVLYPVEGAEDLYAARLSQMELELWPEGGVISRQLVLNKISNLMSDSFPELQEGMLVAAHGSSQVFQCDQGRLRPFITDKALRVWGFSGRSVQPISIEKKATYLEGKPILPFPVIRAHNL
jgi:GT2 family glycosyltransferase